MYKIEVWKCRPTWNTRPATERDALIHRFTAIIQRGSDDETRRSSGPYLIPRPSGCLLVWMWDPEQAENTRAREELRITDLFEPLVYMQATATFTAKTLADRLRA